MTDLRQKQGSADMSLFTMSSAIKGVNPQAAMGSQLNVAPAEACKNIRQARFQPVQNTTIDSNPGIINGSKTGFRRSSYANMMNRDLRVQAQKSGVAQLPPQPNTFLRKDFPTSASHVAFAKQQKLKMNAVAAPPKKPSSTFKNVISKIEGAVKPKKTAKISNDQGVSAQSAKVPQMIAAKPKPTRGGIAKMYMGYGGYYNGWGGYGGMYGGNYYGGYGGWGYSPYNYYYYGTPGRSTLYPPEEYSAWARMDRRWGGYGGYGGGYGYGGYGGWGPYRGGYGYGGYPRYGGYGYGGYGGYYGSPFRRYAYGW